MTSGTASMHRGFIIGAAMNLFNGMNQSQIISSFLMIGLFTVLAGLVSVALVAFYLTARPRVGRVRTAAAWHLGAVFWFLWANVACVWAAPAENSLYDQSTDRMFNLGYERTQKVVIIAIFIALGIGCMLVGFLAASAQARRAQREAVTS